MNDWIKGIIFLILGNILNDVIPYWISQYFLTLPNPFYSVGELLKTFSIRDVFSSNAIVGNFIWYAGVILIVYSLYLFFKKIYKEKGIF